MTAAQIQSLLVLEGYVAMAGELPVARVKIPCQGFRFSNKIMALCNYE